MIFIMSLNTEIGARAKYEHIWNDGKGIWKCAGFSSADELCIQPE